LDLQSKDEKGRGPQPTDWKPLDPKPRDGETQPKDWKPLDPNPTEGLKNAELLGPWQYLWQGLDSS
jgi:hypothetical protein